MGRFEKLISSAELFSNTLNFGVDFTSHLLIPFYLTYNYPNYLKRALFLVPSYTSKNLLVYKNTNFVVAFHNQIIYSIFIHVL